MQASSTRCGTYRSVYLIERAKRRTERLLLFAYCVLRPLLLLQHDSLFPCGSLPISPHLYNRHSRSRDKRDHTNYSQRIAVLHGPIPSIGLHYSVVNVLVLGGAWEKNCGTECGFSVFLLLHLSDPFPFALQRQSEDAVAPSLASYLSPICTNLLSKSGISWHFMQADPSVYSPTLLSGISPP